jgi:hypothetical protein
MLEASIEAQRVLTRAARRGATPLSALLACPRSTLSELPVWTPFPAKGTRDEDSGASWYFHRHVSREHGHFHLFLREKGARGRTFHLIDVAVDRRALPCRLFTTSLLPRGEESHPAATVLAKLDRFTLARARPRSPANLCLPLWLRLFRPQIEQVLKENERVVQRWRRDHPGTPPPEDRRSQAVTSLRVSVHRQLRALRAR